MSSVAPATDGARDSPAAILENGRVTAFHLVLGVLGLALGTVMITRRHNLPLRKTSAPNRIASPTLWTYLASCSSPTAPSSSYSRWSSRTTRSPFENGPLMTAR